ncbi:unnamed protein product [Sphenostylis stenocarpa]|uniref:Uncharacterized protein n=1 Tax=Sphenostylis stenocarpa TaxID=92480 RepID=A0AA86SPS1_9FABA|nr:unnamed protein product [Sphenostylis stenocarpa]
MDFVTAHVVLVLMVVSQVPGAGVLMQFVSEMAMRGVKAILNITIVRGHVTFFAVKGWVLAWSKTDQILQFPLSIEIESKLRHDMRQTVYIT